MLFPGVGWVVVELMVTVSLRVPFGAAPVTRTTTENVAVLPFVMFAFRVKVIVPVPPTGGSVVTVQVLPPVLLTSVAETKVVFAGVLVVTTGLAAVFGPALLTEMEYVICAPGGTGVGVAV